MNNTFSLERAKNGEPFTYDGKPAVFGGMSPDGSAFVIWFEGWKSMTFFVNDSTLHLLSMTPKKLEVKIWENEKGERIALTKDDLRGFPPHHPWHEVKTIEVEI